MLNLYEISNSDASLKVFVASCQKIRLSRRMPPCENSSSWVGLRCSVSGFHSSAEQCKWYHPRNLWVRSCRANPRIPSCFHCGFSEDWYPRVSSRFGWSSGSCWSQWLAGSPEKKRFGLELSVEIVFRIWCWVEIVEDGKMKRNFQQMSFGTPTIQVPPLSFGNEDWNPVREILESWILMSWE